MSNGAKEYRVLLNGESVPYYLERKAVKNINLRIQKDGRVTVSAGKRTPLNEIENFLRQKAGWILKYSAKMRASAEESFPKLRTKEELLAFAEACRLRHAADFGKAAFTVRKMRASWGRCHPASKRITLAEGLCYLPPSLAEYVVYHELCHFKVANHSALFYNVLARFVPDWKERRSILRRKYAGCLM